MFHPLTFIEARILELAQRYGLPVGGVGQQGSIIARHQIDAEVEAFAHILRDLRRLLNDELIGMTARAVPVGTFDIVMKSALQCRTLGEFILAQIAAAHLMYSPPNLYCGIETRDGIAAITYENAYRPNDDFYFVYGFMVTHRGMSWLADERILLKRVSLRSPDAMHLADLQHIFQCEVLLGQPHNAIMLDARYMNTPIRRSADEINDYLRRRPLDVLYIPGTARSLSDRALKLLQEQLHRHHVLAAIEEIATQMQLTPHGLRRQLAREGMSFQDLKDKARYTIAAQQLANSLLPIGEIASTLGFAEPNSFCRAFKRWAGIAPQQYRLQHSAIKSAS